MMFFNRLILVVTLHVSVSHYQTMSISVEPGLKSHVADPARRLFFPPPTLTFSPHMLITAYSVQ